MSIKNAVCHIEKIREIINAWDPMDLLRYDDNEYFGVIEYVAASIRANFSQLQIEKVLLSALQQTYGRVCTVSDADCSRIAGEIYSLLQGEA